MLINFMLIKKTDNANVYKERSEMIIHSICQQSNMTFHEQNRHDNFDQTNSGFTNENDKFQRFFMYGR